MRILMLTWEYPPKVVGGLARAVADLSEALVGEGHDVAVVTSDHPECEPFERQNGVKVYRVNQHYPTPMNFLDSVFYMNFHLLQRASELFRGTWEWDVCHAHDWLVAPAAKVLKHGFKKPMVATIHATEWGRNNGLHTDLQRHIGDIEWWLTYEAYHVICCSDYMRNELKHVFSLPDDKISVISNGVKTSQFTRFHDNLEEYRRQFALPEEKIVFYVGRHVHEKGLDILLGAVPRVLRERPDAKFVIAGTGPVHDQLKHQAFSMGVGHKVHFAGFIDDLGRNSLYRLANVAVFPSRYEPFGIVALEAMAAHAPVVVSDVGGFSEIVRHGENGLTFYAGNSNSLADNILALLNNRELAERVAVQAHSEVMERYDWSNIAKKTLEVYLAVKGSSDKWQYVNPRSKENIRYERYQVTSNLKSKGAEVHESSNHGRW